MEFGCNKCGKTLSEEDFREGLGEVVNGLAWCAECLEEHGRKPEPNRRSRARSRARRGFARGGARAMRARKSVQSRFGSPEEAKATDATDDGEVVELVEAEVIEDGDDAGAADGGEIVAAEVIEDGDDEIEDAEVVYERRSIMDRRGQRRPSLWPKLVAMFIAIFVGLGVLAYLRYPDKVKALTEWARSVVGSSDEETPAPEGDAAEPDASEDGAAEAESPAAEAAEEELTPAP